MMDRTFDRDTTVARHTIYGGRFYGWIIAAPCSTSQIFPEQPNNNGHNITVRTHSQMKVYICTDGSRRTMEGCSRQQKKNNATSGEPCFLLQRFRIQRPVPIHTHTYKHTQFAHQRVGTVGRQDRNVDRGRVVRDAESAVFRLVLRMVEPDKAGDRARDHTEGVLEHHIVHRTPQSVGRDHADESKANHAVDHLNFGPCHPDGRRPRPSQGKV